MTRRRSPAPGVASLALAVLAAACHREPKPEDAAPAPSSVAAPTALAPAKEFHEEAFDLVVRPVGGYAVGTPGSAEIELVAKAGYHCNDKYPYKFKVAQAPGVEFATAVFTKDAVQLAPERATMKVDFTPRGAGEQTVGGQLSFSLCSGERCLVEKRDLALAIAVK